MRFGSKLIHRDLDLTVQRGEILAIVGGSGSGKTTLLREMAMLQEPTAGAVRILGRDTARMDEAQALHVRRRIGVLFQNGALFGGLNVLENIAVPLREHTRLSRPLIEEIACIKLALVGLAERDGLLYPNQLSGGMRKRAALARAIALDPELLFLDEPTSGLDPLSADGFDQLILDLKAAGQSVVLSTHIMQEVAALCDRIVIIAKGRIAADGTPEGLLERSGCAELEDAFVKLIGTEEGLLA